MKHALHGVEMEGIINVAKNAEAPQKTTFRICTSSSDQRLLFLLFAVILWSTSCSITSIGCVFSVIRPSTRRHPWNQSSVTFEAEWGSPPSAANWIPSSHHHHLLLLHLIYDSWYAMCPLDVFYFVGMLEMDALFDIWQNQYDLDSFSKDCSPDFFQWYLRPWWRCSVTPISISTTSHLKSPMTFPRPAWAADQDCTCHLTCHCCPDLPSCHTPYCPCHNCSWCPLHLTQ